MSYYPETHEFLKGLAYKGIFRIDELTQEDRQALVSLYLEEIPKEELPIFDIQEPSRLLMSSFVRIRDIEYSYRLANEITDCVLHNHKSRFEEMLEDAIQSISKEIGVPSDYEDFKQQDNNQRYRDIRDILA